MCVTQPRFKGSLVPRSSHHPVFDCLQYMICQNWTVGRPSKVYHEVDRSSTLTGDQVYMEGSLATCKHSRGGRKFNICY